MGHRASRETPRGNAVPRAAPQSMPQSVAHLGAARDWPSSREPYPSLGLEVIIPRCRAIDAHLSRAPEAWSPLARGYIAMATPTCCAQPCRSKYYYTGACPAAGCRQSYSRRRRALSYRAPTTFALRTRVAGEHAASCSSGWEGFFFGLRFVGRFFGVENFFVRENRVDLGGFYPIVVGFLCQWATIVADAKFTND